MVVKKILLGLLVGLALEAAVPLNIDQTNPFPGSSSLSGRFSLGFGSNPLLAIGQSFVPDLASLSVVRLYTSNPAGVSGPTTLNLNLRSGSILGPVVATAQATTPSAAAPPGPAVATDFEFPTVVPLSSGQTYVLELRYVSGAERQVWYSAGSPDSYPRGRAILLYASSPTNPVVRTDLDFFFAEGSANEAPAALVITSNQLLPTGRLGVSYSQTLVATGGVLPYTWSLYSGAPPLGLELSDTGEISGTPTAVGNTMFTVLVTDGGGNSAIQTFALSIATPSLSFSNALRIPQVVAGGAWKTLFAVVNLEQIPVTYVFRFWDDNGNLWPLPLANRPAGALTGALEAGAAYFAETPGNAAVLQQGWGEVASTGRIGVLTILRQSVPGRPDAEATVGNVTSGSRIFLPFDNTGRFVTGVAVANTGSTPLDVSLLFHLDDGTQITEPLFIPAHGHVAFALPDAFPAAGGVRGSVQFSAASPDLAVFGFRFSPDGSFTSVGSFQ